jgi:SET domain-containing protein
MLLIKTKIDKSLISGIGLFADEDIKKGDIIWRMSSISVFRITPKDYNSLSQIEQDFIQEKDYFWIDEHDNYMIPIDDSRFINHSCSPNIIDLDDNTCVASKDIKREEELTIDYKTLVPKEQWRNYYHNQSE